MAKSTAYIIAEGIDYTYRFCGVTEIEYNFALNIDADTSQGGDIINGARRLPNQIRLSVVETNVSSQPGWSASMLSALDSIRRNRVLCRVVTSMGSWENMLLSEITATQDETNQYGWAGDGGRRVPAGPGRIQQLVSGMQIAWMGWKPGRVCEGVWERAEGCASFHSGAGGAENAREVPG